MSETGMKVLSRVGYLPCMLILSIAIIMFMVNM